MHKLGLLGKNISYSFSKAYFTKKFNEEQLPYSYENFDIPKIEDLKNILKNTDNLIGLNVTIPYKEAVLPFLDGLDKKAKKIGAVNTITISKSGQLKGFNTDCYGFKKSIKPHLKPHHTSALILGTGGASKAIAFVFKALNIPFHYVSRTKKPGVTYLYSELTKALIESHPIIINCSPVGTYPNINECPNIPYQGITDTHILYDLIYNPMQTKFLSHGAAKGATTCNGLPMLEFQAEKAWKIWTSK